jgi:hypothetical protein
MALGVQYGVAAIVMHNMYAPPVVCPGLVQSAADVLHKRVLLSRCCRAGGRL